MTTLSTARGLRVAELAKLVGVRPDTIRYYERVGLLTAPPRSSSGYRHYPLAAADRVRFIQGCQRLGLRLREITELLSVRDTGVCPCEPAEDLLKRRIAELDAELARLSTLRNELASMVETLPEGTCPDISPGEWCPPPDTAEGR